MQDGEKGHIRGPMTFMTRLFGGATSAEPEERVGGSCDLYNTARLSSPDKVLYDPQTVWQRLTLEWYGEGQRKVSSVRRRPSDIALGVFPCLFAES